MSKRRKVLLILGLIALAVVCFATLLPPNEPKYQGVYLSEWLRRYARAAKYPPDQAEAQAAILAVGTNGLPCLLEWMRYQRPAWKITVARVLPRWIMGKRQVFEWLTSAVEERRARDSVDGFRILGTNAISALPELKAMIGGPSSDMAIKALVFVGEAGIPVLEAAFADPEQVNRWYILWGFSDMVRHGHTNRCLPKLVEALTHADVRVRLAATNFVQELAPQFLTNAPAL